MAMVSQCLLVDRVKVMCYLQHYIDDCGYLDIAQYRKCLLTNKNLIKMCIFSSELKICNKFLHVYWLHWNVICICGYVVLLPSTPI